MQQPNPHQPSHAPYPQAPARPMVDEAPPSLSPHVAPRGLTVLKSSADLSGLIGLMILVFSGIVASIFGIPIGIGACIASVACVGLYLTVISK